MAKTLTFTIIAGLLFFLVVEGLLAVAGVRLTGDIEDPFVGFAATYPLFVPAPDDPGRRITAPNKLTYFNPQAFPAKKPAGTYRIFTVGGSTTFGRPYGDATSFSGWLREMLPAADPARSWEVVNAGGISYASYRVATVVEELGRYEPDLFIVYTGHNEFLERRTYGALLDAPVALRETSAWLDHTRVYTTLRRVLGRSREAPRDILPAEVDAVLDRSAGPDHYVRDDAERVRVMNHFRLNLQRIVALARNAGADVLFVTPGSNLADSAPFKSSPTDGLAQHVRDLAVRARAEGRSAAAEERWPDAADAYRQAAELDPRHAETHFELGRALRRAGDADGARGAYVRALEEDVCALRALPESVEILRAVAAAEDVPVVDWARTLTAESPDGIPGREWFVDHVHPTIDGHGRIADGILRTMTAEGWVHPSSGWNDAARNDVAVRVASRIDPATHAQSLANLARVVGWSGKIREAYAHAVAALELDPRHAEAHALAATYAYHLGRPTDARAHAEAALSADQRIGRAHDILGLVLSGEGRLEEALRHHEAAVSLAPESAEARNNLAFALIQLNRVQEALAQTARALRLQPEFAEARNNRGIAHARAGAPDAAIAEFREAIRLRPSYVQAHNNLGLVLAAQGDLQEAARQFETAVRLEPNYEEARDNLGVARQALRSASH